MARPGRPSRTIVAEPRTSLQRYREVVATFRQRVRPARWVGAAAAVLALTAGTASVAPARVASPDRTPPTFAGLESATTCVPGPAGGESVGYRLSWDPATDDVTPSTRLVYDIYQSTTPGGEDFSSPTYTTRRGATTFTTPPLPADKSFYLVVRARDRAGNQDSNRVEREGVNICV